VAGFSYFVSRESDENPHRPKGDQGVDKFAGSEFERRLKGDGPEGAKGRMPGVIPLPQPELS